MRPKYVTYAMNGLHVTHATVPCGETQVETYALCNAVFYPPDDGEKDPILSQDGAVDCKGCLAILETIHKATSLSI